VTVVRPLLTTFCAACVAWSAGCSRPSAHEGADAGVDVTKTGTTAACEERRAHLEAALRVAPRKSLDAFVAAQIPACPVFCFSAGASRLERNRPFRMASVAKTFVATLALRAVARGQLSLDGSLDAYATRIPVLKGTTVRSLLQHTSGLFPYEKDATFLSWQSGPASLRAPNDLLGRALTHSPHARKNAPFAYANTNYVALGLLLEAVGGATLSTQIQKEILDPEALSHTHPERGDEPLVPSFDLAGVETTRAHHPSWLFAAGDLVTTLDDLVRWTRRHGSGAVIPESLRAEWLRTTATEEVGVGYGLGLFVTNGEASGGFGEARSHAGDVAGLHLQAVYFTALDAAIVAVTNQDGGDPDALVLAAAKALSAK
jgi:D-alanyl-D-alanine carboxypeptidase